MIPIAKNGWISNRISYARIAGVVRLAQASAESGAVNPACEMSRCEKFVDYVFCGSVKKQYLNYLHKMTLYKMQASENRAVHPTPAQEDRRRRKMAKVLHYESALSRLMSGNTLKFCLTTAGNEQNWENYLVYRDRRRLTPCGLAVPLPSPVVPAAQHQQITLAPSFATEGEIRIVNLADIRRTGKVACGNQIFTVRFTNENEPIVMQDRYSPQADMLQNKLFNLWSINKVKEKLSNFRNIPLESSKLNNVGEHWPHGTEDRLAYADWIRFTVTMQDRFDKAVSMAQIRLHAQSRLIETEFDQFEQLNNPTKDDKKAFLMLQEKIAVLRRSRDAARENIHYFRSKIEKICDGNYVVEYVGLGNDPAGTIRSDRRYIKDTQTRELFKIRLLKFFEQMTGFFMLEMNTADTIKFKTLCDVQYDVIGRFLPFVLTELTDPPELKTWQYLDIQRPEFYTRHEILFNMLTDPAINWTQIEATMDRMQIEQDSVIRLKIRQIEMGRQLERRINATVRDDHGHGFTIRQGGFDPEYIARMNSIEDIHIALSAPGNYFTKSELDDFSTRIDHDVTQAEQDCSSRGFIPRSVPPVHQNAMPNPLRHTANHIMFRPRPTVASNAV